MTFAPRARRKAQTPRAFVSFDPSLDIRMPENVGRSFLRIKPPLMLNEAR